MSETAHPLPEEEGRPSSAPSADQPNWLMNAEVSAEGERSAPRPEPRHDSSRLNTSNDLSESVPPERPIAPTRPARPQPTDRSVGPTPWTAAASSVPKLRIEAAAAPVDADADFDQPLRSGRPKPVVAIRPVRPVRPTDEDEDEDEPRTLSPHSDLDGEGEEEEDGFPADGPRNVIALPVRKLDEPFWIVALDWMQVHPLAVIGTAVALAAIVATWAMWPRSEKGISLHELRTHAARWDAQTVRLNGRVGEVFNVGAGWAYYLHQGRDTIVVFTRGTPPRSRAHVSIVGSVSTGYLDGSPRQAIFQNP